MEKHTFNIVDYVVMTVFLSVSLGIGIFYGVCKKQTTTEEYLLGSRRLHMLPVAISLMVSFQSAVSLMGTPAEIYTYDTMIVYTNLSIVACCLFQAYLLVPLLYPLKLVSVYEYLYQRFQSRAVQSLGAFIGMLQTLLYMAIVLFAPSLALESVAGLPFWLSVLLMGLIGTIYTSLGGMRSVVWTDVFQCIVLYGGLVVIIIMGSDKIGGFDKMFTIANESGRINFSSVSFDPRVRHTVWSCFIGGIFNWLPITCNQASIQRISSMKNEKQAKSGMLVNIPLVVVYLTLVTFTGLLAFSYFQLQQCDPLQAGFISSANQVMLFFVMYVLRNAKGLAGVYIAALFSGSLSTFSSGINGMAANTLHDVFVGYFQNMKQFKQTLIAKLIVVVYGIFAVILAFLIRKLPGPVTQISYTVSGGTGGPLVGIILLGATFPQANWIGAICGGLVGIAVNAWIGVGAVVYGNKSVSSSLPVPTTGCSDFYLQATTNISFANVTTQPEFSHAVIATTEGLSETTSDGHLPLYDMSYAYIGMVGFLVSVVTGLIVSICSGCDTHARENPKYLFPFVRRFFSKRNVYSFESGLKTSVSTEQLNSPVQMESLKYLQKTETNLLNTSVDVKNTETRKSETDIKLSCDGKKEPSVESI